MPAPALAALPTPSAAPAAPLDLDERLALAALAVSDSGPLDLADVIRLPVALPAAPAPCPCTAPVAACLWRAARRVEAGWCTGRLRDEQGRTCLLGAIRAEAGSGGEADDAAVILLDAIRREFPGAETVPSWNDQQTGVGRPAEFLRRAAILAAARGL